jgi:hypothetical protein
MTIPGTTGASGISEAWSAYPNTLTAHATHDVPDRMVGRL